MSHKLNIKYDFIIKVRTTIRIFNRIFSTLENKDKTKSNLLQSILSSGSTRGGQNMVSSLFHMYYFLFMSLFLPNIDFVLKWIPGTLTNSKSVLGYLRQRQLRGDIKNTRGKAKLLFFHSEDYIAVNEALRTEIPSIFFGQKNFLVSSMASKSSNTSSVFLVLPLSKIVSLCFLYRLLFKTLYYTKLQNF